MAEKGRLAVSSLLKEERSLRNNVPTKLIIRQSTDPAISRPDQETEFNVR